MTNVEDLPFQLNEQKEALARLIIESYRQWIGTPLIETDPNKPLLPQLYFSPIIVLSHGTEADPILQFGNKAALQLWEMEWDSFTRMPSSKTAEPVERTVRSEFMRAVSEKGYISDYTGVRISNTGKRFQIEQATVWNLVDPNGTYKGQAAAFDRFTYCD